ncbi:MAG: hypothetical protein H7249_02120 [Chitinophagaceae bacterium]|nr:hypothetical protein [Oligoflexus sp.]
MLSIADTNSHNGTTVTNFRRILGTKGAVVQSGFTDLGTSWGRYVSLPASGTAPNAFDVQMVGHYQNIPNTKSFQQYDGNYYAVLSAYPTSLLKATATAVTYSAVDFGMASFTLLKSGTDDILYYCSTNGQLRKRNLTTPTSPAESQVSLLIPGATCAGSSLIHYTTGGQDYLMLIYAQNALNGIIELKITP